MIVNGCKCAGYGFVAACLTDYLGRIIHVRWINVISEVVNGIQLDSSSR